MQVISPDFEDHLREIFEKPKDRERVKVLEFRVKKKDKKKKAVPVKKAGKK